MMNDSVKQFTAVVDLLKTWLDDLGVDPFPFKDHDVMSKEILLQVFKALMQIGVGKT